MLRFIVKILVAIRKYSRTERNSWIINPSYHKGFLFWAFSSCYFEFINAKMHHKKIMNKF